MMFKNKTLIVIVALVLLFFVFFVSKSKYMDSYPKPPSPRMDDTQVEVESVADIAMTSGACGMRPMI